MKENKVHSKFESQNVHIMLIMQEFPKNKPNFPFKHIQDFNQTIHVAPYRPIIFTDDISLYFNFLSSVQNVLKESQTVVIDF